MDRAGTAILLFGNDVCESAREAYERWHSGHHVPQRLTVPGILGAIRFRLARHGSPEYLTLYRLRDSGVVESPEYRALLEHPDPPTIAMRANILRPRRFVASVGSMPAIPEGLAMQVWQGRSAIETRKVKGQVVISGPLVAGRRNHPIMGLEPMPEGYLLLCFAHIGQFGAVQDVAPPSIGGLYTSINRFGLDGCLFS